MGQEHRRRAAVPDLQRVDEQLVGCPVHVGEQLRRVAYLGHGSERVPAAQDGEVSHRVQREQVRTGHTEEVPHHQVRRPCDLELAQAVEHIEGIPAFLGDHAPDRHREGLEALLWVEFVYLQPIDRLEQGRMRGKPDVDEVPPIADCLVCEWLVEEPEIIEARQLPDHVVAQADVVEHGVERGNAALDPIECRHGAL